MRDFLNRLRCDLLHLTGNASCGNRRHRRSPVRQTVSAERLEVRDLLSAVALVVEDAVPGGGINNDAGLGSEPDSLINVSGVLYFRAFDSINGLELWRLNSAGVAELVEDAIPGGGIRPGAASGVIGFTAELTAVNNTLYFIGDDGVNGSELWRINSSGIAEMVEDAIPGQGIATGTFRDSSPANLTNIGGTLYFEASDEGTGRELWRINSAGIAEMVEDAVPGNGIRPGNSTFGEVLQNATNVNGTLYFRMQPELSSRAELWRVNSSGIAEAVPVSIPAGVVSRPEIAAKFPENLMNVNGTLYFTAWDGNTSGELWRVNSSGVAELVDDSTPGIGISPGFTFSPYISQLSNVNGTLYFRGNDGVNGPELWRINDSGIAEMVEDAVPGGGLVPGGDGSSPRGLTDVNGTLYFLADGIHVWRVNSSGIAERVAIAPSSPQNALIGMFDVGQDVNGTFYFLGSSDDLNGGEVELWRVNSSGFAELVEDSVPGGGIRPGSESAEIRYLTNINGTLYFQANDGTNGVELWRINATGIAEIVGRTDGITGINPGANGSFPRIDGGAEVNGVVFFNAGAGAEFGRELLALQTNSAPVNLTLSNQSLPENSPIGTTVGQLRTFDPNISNTFTYALVPGIGGDDNASFQISGDLLQTVSPLNFEVRSSYSIRVRTTDQEGLSFEKVFTITVTNVNEAPTGLTLSNASVAENSAVGTTVGTLTGADPDAGNTLTYALIVGTGSTDNSAFTISGNTLKTAASFNFESKSSYSIRVRATDQGGLAFEQVFTISVTNVNESPTALALSASTVPENTALGTSIGTFSTTDPDTGNSFTYLLVAGAGGDDNASFSIADNVLKTASALNFETKASYSVRVRTTDQNGLSFEQVFPISITNVNETPTALILSGNTIAENAPLNSTVGSFTTSDPDTANTFTYSLVTGAGSTDNSSFSIAGNTLSTAALLNFESKSSYSVRVRTTDQGGLSFEQTFTITVTNVNEAPTGLTLSNASVPENSAVGTTVGTFNAADPDAGNTLTYALIAGTGSTDNSAFTISGNILKTAASFNFETKSSYSIRVKATDQGGLAFEQVFTISVTNVNESPTALALSASTIPENSALGTSIGTFSTTDPDAGNSFTYLLVAGAGGDDNASFSIADNVLKTASALNFETKASYSVRVRTTDQNGLSFEQVFPVSVTNVNETPTALILSGNTIAENAALNSTVGSFTTSDPDTANTFTYSLVTGTGSTDNSSFSIAGNSLRTAAPLNFETKSSYSVRVRTTDQGGLSFEQTFTITVTNVNEAPTGLTLSNASVPENSVVGTTVGTLTGADPDAGNTLTYALIAGTGSTDNSAFTITGNILKTAASLNFESKSSYSIRVKATDQGGLAFEQVFTISVTNVNESPTRVTLSSTNVAENLPAGAIVGMFTTSDPDVISTFSYSLIAGPGNTDNARFRIEGNTLRTTGSFDFESRSTYSIRMRSSDQGGLSLDQVFTVNVSNVNDAPVIGAFDTAVTYTENGIPTILDSNATVVDVDSLNLSTGKLTATVSANSQLTDRIGVRNGGNAAGQIGVAGNLVSYGGVTIGTLTGTTTLVVTLNTNATPVAVQALLRSLTFSSVSDAPSTLDRTVTVSLTDGDGGTSNLVTKLVKVVAANDAPVIGAFDTTVTYTENGVPTILDSNATVVDVDSLNLSTGKLTATVSANSQLTDRIGVRNGGNAAGQIGVVGNAVSYGGLTIGTLTGTTTLVVTLNTNATPAAVQALLRSLTFSSVSDAPSTLDRTVTVSLTDGDGGTSNLVTKLVKVVAVNDAPVIGAFDTTVTYTENGIPTILDSNATVVDVDSLNLSTGKLTATVSANSQLTDRIGVRHIGNAAGQIGVAGNVVSYGGVTIGTLTGTTTLVVTLNTNATPVAVQALLRSLTFSSVSDAPSTLDRTVTVSLTDGDGGTSNLVTKLVKVVAVNDAPVIGAFNSPVSYTPNGIPVVIGNTATVSDGDSANFDTGVLTVSVITGGELTDRLEIRNQGVAVRQIGVSGANVTYEGTVIGTFAGTTSLAIRLNSSASVSAVQALLRNITFRSASAAPSTAARTIRATLTDGDGGTSSPSTKTITVAGGISPLRTVRSATTPEFSDLDQAFSAELIETDLLAS